MPDSYVSREKKIFKSTKQVVDTDFRVYLKPLIQQLLDQGYSPFILGSESIFPHLKSLARHISIMDYGFNIEACKDFCKSVFKVDWAAVEYEDFRIFDNAPGKKVLVIIDVLGEMKNPDTLISSIKNISNSFELIVVSPERDSQKNNVENGPPELYFRCREWNATELHGYISTQFTRMVFHETTIVQHLANSRMDSIVYSSGLSVVFENLHQVEFSKYVCDDLEFLPDLEITTFDFTLGKNYSAQSNPIASCFFSSSNQVVDLLSKNLVDRTPSSLVRVGHAEIRFAGFPEYVQPIWLSRSLRVCFGSGDITEDYSVLYRDMLASFRDADFLGLPSRIESDQHWKHAIPLLTQYGCEPMGKVCHSQNIHLEVLLEGGYEKIFKLVDSVLIIGCRDLRKKLEKTYSLTDVEWIEIPGEAKFVDGTSLDHYPDIYMAIREQMKEKIKPLTLVGAGLAGNSYCMWAKELGSVAMDIGSVMDVWAGQNTRSSFSKFSSYAL